MSSAAQALRPMRIGVPRSDIIKRAPLPQEEGSEDNSSSPQEADVTTADEPSPTGDEDTPEETTAPDEPTTTKTTTSTPTPTPDDQPTNNNNDNENTPTPTEVRSTPTSTSISTSEKPASTETKDNLDPTTTSATQVPTTKTITAVSTITRDDGSVMTTTDVSTSTGLATLSNENDGNTSGMSTSTRNTIIGVVVGVGGAIILAGVALAIWKIRNKRKNAEENDGLIGYGGYTAGAAEKPDSFSAGGPSTTGGRTPFQSTLESYHTPTQVNQASNF